MNMLRTVALLAVVTASLCRCRSLDIGPPVRRIENDGDTLGIVATPGSEIIEISVRDDTLSVVSANDFLWFPFGVFRSLTEETPGRPEGFLRIFPRATFKRSAYFLGSDSLDIEEDSLWVLESGDDQLVLMYDPNFGWIILSGTFRDRGIRLPIGIRIGMTVSAFTRMFFSTIPRSLLRRFKVVEMKSAVTGAWHVYRFERGRLVEIVFPKDSGGMIHRLDP